MKFKQVSSIFTYQDTSRASLDYDKKHVLYNVRAYGNNQLWNIKENVSYGRDIADKGFTVEMYLDKTYFNSLFESPTYKKDFKEYFLEMIKENRLGLVDNSITDYSQNYTFTDYDSIQWVTEDIIEEAYTRSMEQRRIKMFFKILIEEGREKRTKLKFSKLEKMKLNSTLIRDIIYFGKITKELLKKHFYSSGVHIQDYYLTDKYTVEKIEMLKSVGVTFEKGTNYNKLMALTHLTTLGD